MAIKINLTMDQGSQFEELFQVADPNGNNDLSVYSTNAQMRKHYTSLTAIDLDTTLRPNGQLVLSLSSDKTAEIEPGRYLYDVEISNPDGSVIRIVEGIITVTPNITR